MLCAGVLRAGAGDWKSDCRTTTVSVAPCDMTTHGTRHATTRERHRTSLNSWHIRPHSTHTHNKHETSTSLEKDTDTRYQDQDTQHTTQQNKRTRTGTREHVERYNKDTDTKVLIHIIPAISNLYICTAATDTDQHAERVATYLNFASIRGGSTSCSVTVQVTKLPPSQYFIPNTNMLGAAPRRLLLVYCKQSHFMYLL